MTGSDDVRFRQRVRPDDRGEYHASTSAVLHHAARHSRQRLSGPAAHADRAGRHGHARGFRSPGGRRRGSARGDFLSRRRGPAGHSRHYRAQDPDAGAGAGGVRRRPAPLPGTPALVQPTPTVRQIQVAEQIFERGRMFWLQPTAQIWVMVLTGEGVGDWYVYEDFFREGDPEFDPGIVPPDEDLKQPIRGFGRLWRENRNVREQLGWATTDEFGFVTRYEYHPALSLEMMSSCPCRANTCFLVSMARASSSSRIAAPGGSTERPGPRAQDHIRAREPRP